MSTRALKTTNTAVRKAPSGLAHRWNTKSSRSLRIPGLDRIKHPSQLTMRRIVVRDLLGLLANIKARRTVAAPQPRPADLVRVDIAQRLAVEHVFEVRGRVPGVDHCARGDLTHARAVQDGQERAGRSQRDMYRTVKLEEDVAGVVESIRAELAYCALASARRMITQEKKFGCVDRRTHQVVRLGLGRAVGTLIPPAHDPLVAVVAPHAVVERVARGDVHNVRGRDRRAAVGAVRAACIDRFVGGRRRAG